MGLARGRFAQSTGVVVDNTEALGALSDERNPREDEIEQGRFEWGGIVRCWRVNGPDVTARCVIFRGRSVRCSARWGLSGRRCAGPDEGAERLMGGCFRSLQRRCW